MAPSEPQRVYVYFGPYEDFKRLVRRTVRAVLVLVAIAATLLVLSIVAVILVLVKVISAITAFIVWLIINVVPWVAAALLLVAAIIILAQLPTRILRRAAAAGLLVISGYLAIGSTLGFYAAVGCTGVEGFHEIATPLGKIKAECVDAPERIEKIVAAVYEEFWQRVRQEGVYETWDGRTVTVERRDIFRAPGQRRILTWWTIDINYRSKKEQVLKAYAAYTVAHPPPPGELVPIFVPLILHIPFGLEIVGLGSSVGLAILAINLMRRSAYV